MSDVKTAPRESWPQWAREHKACFEITPLTEVRGKESIQVGFEISLFAQISKLPPGAEARQENIEIYHTLRKILESVVGPEHPVARVDLGPARAAAKLRPQTGFAPEIELNARVVRREQTFEAVPSEARQGLGFLEDGLIALGLTRGAAG